MKKVRMLLRVSSNQQLEADGDLTIQRQLVREYIEKCDEWELDEKEYFEGSNSGYKKSVKDRDKLQEALDDAQNHEYDILVVYKDDRLGRRMWDIGAYVMSLKKFGVDVYTVKDGCISPDSDDVMGQMMLALRYGNAQKSSSDTGMRVKDTAQKLVQQGKFLGGSAPYGYELVYSGEISKHGRALKKLQIVPEQETIIKYIYYLAANKEFGSSKIAKILNEDTRYASMAPRDVWKGNTIASIVTNPIYTGRAAYKRRERKNGSICRLDSSEWIIAESVNEDIKIIDDNTWNKVQESRKQRNPKYTTPVSEKDVNIIKSNTGELSLIDVIYCGECGCKLTNGSKYNYWTIKSTGEKKGSKIGVYKCQHARNGVPHRFKTQYKAEEIESVVYKYIGAYIDSIQDNKMTFDEIQKNQTEAKLEVENEIKKLKQELEKAQKGIEIMEDKLPIAMMGNYPFSVDELAEIIKTHKKKLPPIEAEIEEKKKKLAAFDISQSMWENIEEKLPKWKEVFMSADNSTKRVMINKIIDKIIITDDEITIKFKINYDDFQYGITDDFDTIPCILYSA